MQHPKRLIARHGPPPQILVAPAAARRSPLGRGSVRDHRSVEEALRDGIYEHGMM